MYIYGDAFMNVDNLGVKECLTFFAGRVCTLYVV